MRMPHIHTNPGEFDVTASALVMRFDSAKPRLLLHVHKKFGRLMQPGGHVELTETPWQAVLHELIEETGYSLDQLKLLQPKQRLRSLSHGTLHPVPVCESSHSISEDHQHTDRAYAFATQSLPIGLPAAGESTDFTWVNSDELRGLSQSEIGSDIREIGLYALHICALEWEQLPLTAFGA